MSRSTPTARVNEGGRAASDEQRLERAARLHVDGHSSVTRSIAHALVLKDRDLFFLCEPDGAVPVGGEHGLGLYYHDCRFLHGYELRLDNVALEPLASTAQRGFTAVVQLTNPEMQTSDGHVIRRQTLGITWRRTLDRQELALHDVFVFQNFGTTPVRLPMSLVFTSAFEPIFVVRGMLSQRRGTLHEPVVGGDEIRFRYDGADQKPRELSIRLSLPELVIHDATATMQLELAPRARCEHHASLFIAEGSPLPSASGSRTRVDVHAVEARAQRRSDRALERSVRVDSNAVALNRVVGRSLRDLHLLETGPHDLTFFAAGVPWYVALFGRDSLIAALQMLAFDREIAADTLRVMAKHQGTATNEWRDEEPGKIMHELRVGELAHLDEIPQTPYYGSVDATPLFLVLLGRHAAWSGSLELFNELQGHVSAALRWLSIYGDRNGDGFVEYRSTSTKGLANQGWKDSGDAICNEDGSLAEPPISLVEVQGYCYEAKRLIADLYRRSGDSSTADRLVADADRLRARFNTQFWLEDRQFYALALQGDGRPAAVISSNPGQALWTGIVDEERAPRVIARLLADDMFSGWGIRTLSSKESRYNPVGYHIGTVWPHDNGLIAAGFRRYGADKEACDIFSSIVDAATFFEHYRLPEAFGGFSRSEFEVPVRYPVACHPQAWAAGSVPMMLGALLGLTPEAFEQRLHIVRPVLPEFVEWLTLERLKVGAAQVNLRFTRGSNGSVETEVTDVQGRLDVIVEPH
jgi:glycogen debranching enzyme